MHLYSEIPSPINSPIVLYRSCLFYQYIQILSRFVPSFADFSQIVEDTASYFSIYLAAAAAALRVAAIIFMLHERQAFWPAAFLVLKWERIFSHDD